MSDREFIKDLKDGIDRLEVKIDKISGGLTDHQSKIKKNETDLNWVKGSIKILYTGVVTTFFGLILVIFRKSGL